MPRYAYVNGRYLPHGQAAVHIEDRGYQFADGVYEVVPVAGGRAVDEIPHLDRLERSLAELRIAMPISRRALELVSRELLRRNDLRDGLIYIQITRGVAPRNHAFPAHARPALVMTTKRMGFAGQSKFKDGVAVITVPDLRWARRDIKTINLLPNCLAKQAAAEAGAYEALQVDDEGNVTEGTSSNAWIVTRDGKLVTRHLSNDILHGVTRRTILAIATEEGVAFEERPFTVEEALGAREAFVTSATSFVTPVVEIDGGRVGGGKPGPLTRRLLAWYRDYVAGLRDSA
ncbi:MAG: D-amino-acid transaminase [Alphaproteobacteria bacterium]|jgi:D-alanine transaminase|nr:D-amino-acid transaminase [Alphaproteobacteria bacterium]